MLLPNVSGWQGQGSAAAGSSSHVKANVMQAIFPTTVVELGPGWIVGRERLVTKASRGFTFPPSPRNSNGAGHAAAGPSVAMPPAAGLLAMQLRVRYFDRRGWLTSVEHVRGPRVQVHVDGGGARAFAVVDTAPAPARPRKTDEDRA